MSTQISSKITVLTFGILVISFLAAFYVVAWQEPSSAPPNGNVSVPLNTSNTGQSKAGGLILNTGGAVNGLVVDKGNLCLGTDCRSTWPVGGNVLVVNGSSCPSGYSAVMYYYQPNTCSSQLCWWSPQVGYFGCQPYSSCTTPSGWGLAISALYYDYFTNDWYPSYPNGAMRSLMAIPACQYSNISGNQSTGYTSQGTICYASTKTKTLCAINNP